MTLGIIPIKSGRILIDGIDISTVPLAVLRQRIAFVPQEPFIFNLSIRDNIDPLHVHTEEQLWNALAKVGMREMVLGFELQLEQQDLKLSQGEMQLISLARALLKEPKILFLDEFTSKLDSATEKKVLDICYTQLHDCSVVSIVHNLETVFKLDKVIVLENGKIVENASPKELASNPESFLAKFIHHSRHE
jgi:ABC-type multidrug transport system fused ATPase/permease subunit